LKQYTSISNFTPLDKLIVAKQQEKFQVYYVKQVLIILVHNKPSINSYPETQQ